MSAVRVFRASAALELALLRGSGWFVALTALAAISFLVLVSLFGLTGAHAPMALINLDGGPYSYSFIEALNGAHHSFNLESVKKMSAVEAETALHSGRLVGIITIPAGFSDNLARGVTLPVDVRIDNVNVDMTNDVQRALPAAIVAFGKQHDFPGVRVQMVEHDVLPHDTGYIPYLVVSALALDAMVIAGILGAMATSREWENKTVKLLRLAPASPGAVLAGKLAVAALVAAVALGVAVSAIVFVYGVVPVAPWATILALAACVAIFTCIGAWFGALLKRTLAAVPLMFGLAMPFYVDSGALEPTRFDGDTIWTIAHLSPVYYAVGVLEWAFHGLHVTPEPIYVDLLVLVVIAIVSGMLTLGRLSKGVAR
jgi:ABC-type Na+ efflux pump permease subunit